MARPHQWRGAGREALALAKIDRIASPTLIAAVSLSTVTAMMNLL
jgi:hypothetical protein